MYGEISESRNVILGKPVVNVGVLSNWFRVVSRDGHCYCWYQRFLPLETYLYLLSSQLKRLFHVGSYIIYDGLLNDRVGISDCTEDILKVALPEFHPCGRQTQICLQHRQKVTTKS
jgi:hypothetical protein